MVARTTLRVVLFVAPASSNIVDIGVISCGTYAVAVSGGRYASVNNACRDKDRIVRVPGAIA
jgi:hypothetical protein